MVDRKEILEMLYGLLAKYEAEFSEYLSIIDRLSPKKTETIVAQSSEVESEPLDSIPGEVANAFFLAEEAKHMIEEIEERIEDVECVESLVGFSSKER